MLNFSKRHFSLFLLFILVGLISYAGNADDIFANDNRPGLWHEDERFADYDRPENVDDMVSATERTMGYVEAMLGRGTERMGKVVSLLGHANAWGSLGPHAPAGPEAPSLPRPEKTVRLEIPDGAEGEGTADDPYVDVISGYLEQFQFEPHDVEGYRGYPDREEIAEYMARLDYEPVTIIVPPGHYIESFETRSSPLTRVSDTTAGINVPPGVWLAAETAGETVIRPRVSDDERGSLIQLHPRAGLTGFVLDGSDMPFEVDKMQVSAVSAHHEAVIAGNHIRRFNRNGVSAAGNRGRAGSYVIVHDNIIEWVGRSGISSQSHWLIQDNQIRYAGVLRSTGGGGDDGIIPRWGDGGRIINNLVILSRRPHARHVISAQSSHNQLVAGNVSVVETNEEGRGMRNNIQFSDGAHHNWFVGNLAISAGGASAPAIQSVAANGYGNVAEFNASIHNPQGFRMRGREDQPLCWIRHNYAEYRRNGIHRSSYYEAYDNELINARHIDSVPVIDPEKFGFFGDD